MCYAYQYFKNAFIFVGYRKLSSIYVYSYFPFGFEGRIWDLIVSVPDHCLSFYLSFNDIVWTNDRFVMCLSNLNQIIQIVKQNDLIMIMHLLLSYLKIYGNVNIKNKACNYAHKKEFPSGLG